MNGWKRTFYELSKKYYNKTGKAVAYEHQQDNGNYLWIESLDNGGMGYYIGVEGFKEATHYVEGMLAMYNLMNTGRV